MSSGPNIVEDGLVFYYDLNNTKSYVGEPTTNLVNPTWNAWGIDASGYSASGTRTIITPYHCRIDDIASNTRQAITMGNVIGNSIYTFSVKYRKISGTPTLRFQIYSFDGGAYVQVAFPTTAQLGIVDTHEWQTATFNYTTSSGANGLFWYMQDGDDYVPYTHSFELKEPQVEKKSHATSFVHGSRSNTQGLKDLTLNHSVDISSVSFDGNSKMIFDGTNDYISIGNSGQLNITTDVSIFAWIKLDNTSEWDGIFGTYDGGGFIHFQMYLGGVNCYLYGPDVGYDRIDASNCYISSNQWSEIGMTFGSNILTLFINGIAMPTTVTGSGNSVSSTQNVSMGRVYDGGRCLGGNINIVRTYNRKLSQTEITQNYNATKNRFI